MPHQLSTLRDSAKAKLWHMFSVAQGKNHESKNWTRPLSEWTLCVYCVSMLICLCVCMYVIFLMVYACISTIINVRMYAWMDEWMENWTHAWMCGGIEVWMSGWLGWDGWDGCAIASARKLCSVVVYKWFDSNQRVCLKIDGENGQTAQT